MRRRRQPRPTRLVEVERMKWGKVSVKWAVKNIYCSQVTNGAPTKNAPLVVLKKEWKKNC